MSIEVRFRKLRESATLPAYHSTAAAGADLMADLDKAIRLMPMQRVAVPTGLAMELPAGFEGQVRPRSGLALKHGIGVLNAPGTIDADYRGEIKVILINLGEEPFVIEPGMRIAQLVIASVSQPRFALVSELEASERGEGGFGSTGLGGRPASEGENK